MALPIAGQERFSRGGYTERQVSYYSDEINSINVGRLYFSPIADGQPYQPSPIINYRRVKLTDTEGRTVELMVNNVTNTVEVDFDAMLALLGEAGFELKKSEEEVLP